MDLFDWLEIARQFKPGRRAVTLAFIACAISFHDQLTTVIVNIAQERADEFVERILGAVLANQPGAR